MPTKFTRGVNNLKAQLRVDKNMRDYSKEEFFLKKKALAEEMIEKYGLPDEEMIKQLLKQ